MRYLLPLLAALMLLPAAADTRSDFLKIVQPRKTDLNPEVRSSTVEGAFIREKVVIQSEPGQPVAMLVLRPREETSRRRSAVIVLHGTRGRKEGSEGWLKDLAFRGFVAIATDARWHGELAKADYEDAIIQAYKTGKGHPWLYDTVTDNVRVLDYLQTRPDIDPDRIGMMGISMGGMNTYLTAAADPRVKVAVPLIGVTSFGYQLETGKFAARAATLPKFHHAVAEALGETEINARVVREAWTKVLPGILDRFDCPRMLEQIAPRPLLICNGEKDERCPLESVQLCYHAAETAYAKAGATDHLRMIIAPDTGHAVTPAQHEAAVEWFVRWLKP